MSLWKIAWRSIQQRALASALTTVAMGLGVALVVAVLVIHGVVDQSFNRGAEGYHLVIGKVGSPLQLVLNSAFYLGNPVGNIPYECYEEFTEGRYAMDVETAVPICMGHSYKGYPVVGTTPEMFDLKYLGDREYEFAEGSCFDPENLYDAVVGATVARAEGWTVGSTFQADHGGKTHDQKFKVAGVLKPTGTPNDRAVFVNMHGFYDIHDHEESRSKAAADPSPSELEESSGSKHQEEPAGAHEHDHAHQAKEVTAVLVCLRPKKQWRIDEIAFAINQGSVIQAAKPSYEIAILLDKLIGKIQVVLLGMAVMIVVVAGIGILVSIYNSMNDRRHEIAVMRALGASRLTVMAVILLESILLSLGGGVLGLLLGHGLIALAAPMIVEQTQVAVGLLHFRPIELILIPGLILLASLVGYLPAVTAYRTDVARSLTASP